MSDDPLDAYYALADGARDAGMDKVAIMIRRLADVADLARSREIPEEDGWVDAILTKGQGR